MKGEKYLLNNILKRTKMAAEVDTLHLLTQPELTENQTARKSNTKEIKNKHSSRPVGGAERGTRAERTGLAVADRDWWSVGQAGQVVQPLADPAAPHLRTDKPRWPDSRVAGSEADCITQGQGGGGVGGWG